MTPLPKKQIRVLRLGEIVRACRQPAHSRERGTPHALRGWREEQVLVFARGLGELDKVGRVEEGVYLYSFSN